MSNPRKIEATYHAKSFTFDEAKLRDNEWAPLDDEIIKAASKMFRKYSTTFICRCAPLNIEPDLATMKRAEPVNSPKPLLLK
jgi:hypothetical protein